MRTVQCKGGWNVPFRIPLQLRPNFQSAQEGGLFDLLLRLAFTQDLTKLKRSGRTFSFSQSASELSSNTVSYKPATKRFVAINTYTDLDLSKEVR